MQKRLFLVLLPQGKPCSRVDLNSYLSYLKYSIMSYFSTEFEFSVGLQELFFDLAKCLSTKFPEDFSEIISDIEVVKNFSLFFSPYLKKVYSEKRTIYEGIVENQGLEFLEASAVSKKENIKVIVSLMDSDPASRMEIADFFVYRHPDHKRPEWEKHDISLEDLKYRGWADWSREY